MLEKIIEYVGDQKILGGKKKHEKILDSTTLRNLLLFAKFWQISKHP